MRLMSKTAEPVRSPKPSIVYNDYHEAREGEHCVCQSRNRYRNPCYGLGVLEIPPCSDDRCNLSLTEAGVFERMTVAATCMPCNVYTGEVYIRRKLM